LCGQQASNHERSCGWSCVQLQPQRCVAEVGFPPALQIARTFSAQAMSSSTLFHCIYSAVPPCCLYRLWLRTSMQKLEQGLLCVDWLAPDSNCVTLWSPALPGLPNCPGSSPVFLQSSKPASCQLSGSLLPFFPVVPLLLLLLLSLLRHSSASRSPGTRRAPGHAFCAGTPAAGQHCKFVSCWN
jgi:hypothetical protein